MFPADQQGVVHRPGVDAKGGGLVGVHRLLDPGGDVAPEGGEVPGQARLSVPGGVGESRGLLEPEAGGGGTWECPHHDPPGGGAEIYCGYTAIRHGWALAQVCGGDSGVHGDVEAGGVGHVRDGGDVDGVGDVFGEHFSCQSGALRVGGAQVFFLDAVGRGAVGAPPGGEDTRALHHAVGVDAVDLDSVFTQFDGQQAHLVGLVGLGGGVGDVVGPGEHRVLGGDVDDVSAHVLFDEDLRGGLGDQEGALGHHIVLAVPVRFGGLQQRA